MERHNTAVIYRPGANPLSVPGPAIPRSIKYVDSIVAIVTAGDFDERQNNPRLNQLIVEGLASSDPIIRRNALLTISEYIRSREIRADLLNCYNVEAERDRQCLHTYQEIASRLGDASTGDSREREPAAPTEIRRGLLAKVLIENR